MKKTKHGKVKWPAMGQWLVDDEAGFLRTLTLFYAFNCHMPFPERFCCNIKSLKESRGERGILSPLHVKGFLYRRYILKKPTTTTHSKHIFFPVNEIIKLAIWFEILKESCHEFVPPNRILQSCNINLFSCMWALLPWRQVAHLLLITSSP